MTTLISFLGKNKADTQTGYRKANYCFEPDFSRAVSFFGLALLDYAKPDRLILAGTAGSMWDVFFEHQHTDDEATLALMDAVEREAVTTQMLAIHEQPLSEKLGIPVQCLLISYARDEAEQTTILSDLADHLAPGEKVILDVTHGFRHLPMLALVAARYLARVRQVQVQEVYYGALEMTDPASKQTPVLRLSAMLQMLDWIDALAVYESSGNYGIFAPLLQQDGMQPDRANLLAQAAYFERNGNPVQAKQSLSGAHNHVRDHQGPLGQLFKTTLTEHIGWFRQGSRADWELALADRYLARQDYLRAITYLCEAYISRATERLGGNVNQFEDRDRAFKEADKNQDVWLLKHLRNAMTHGVRTDNRDAKPLLQDQKALDTKLHSLRKSLFQ
jgi:CRISPR-associated Csx2 family protein